MKTNIKTTFPPNEDVEAIFAGLLKSRGFNSDTDIQSFLSPPTPDLSYLLAESGIDSKSLKSAKKRIDQAIKKKEQIVIFGDYDADGVTATALLWLTLTELGAQVMPFIPHREKHGYGLSSVALSEVISGSAFSDSPRHPFKPTLIITVDNGIVAGEQVALAKEGGVDVIITDHHKTDTELPPAHTLIHSVKTSGSVVAWILALYLTKESKFAANLIDITTIGLVADQLPLIDLNRSIASLGLKTLSSTQHTGLLALFELLNITDKSLSTYDIGFVIAPRINAAGRLDSATTALRLLCTKNRTQAHSLATELDDINKQRQDITEQALSLVRSQDHPHKIVIVSSDAFHDGIIGLVAGNLVEETGRPALAINISGDTAKGSARSIKGVDITDILRTQQDLTTGLGGHPAAAGFSLPTKNLAEFTHNLQELADKQITDEMLISSVTVDASISLSQASKSLCDLISQMEPFGLGNPRPKFISTDLNIIEMKSVGQTGAHTKLVLEKDGVTHQAIWFNSRQDLDSSRPVDVIYSLDLNHWQGRTTLNLVIKYAIQK